MERGEGGMGGREGGEGREGGRVGREHTDVWERVNEPKRRSGGRE